MVEGFLYEVPEEYINMPFLKRRVVYMKDKIKDNPNLQDCVFHIVFDGYNAPVTAGNFVDLAERNFYNGMEIQKSDGFVVQTRDPDGHAEGFIDPTTEKVRTVPLEIMGFENDSESSQVFWLLKERELTPSNSNTLDGRYDVFGGYVTQNEDFLADLKVDDVTEFIQVVSG
ncbi:peptidyl-prolyl cis-trans isomerase CYP38, chloroplastic-like [Brassica rapa]|uniref:peptidyl-prolyl cis-trans isomerase CYP38, chloroplastic-like n=1 Tax=Brassica campestris TaxID=3711 RepID=UPI00142D3386|nr:peptidyl-prolyl cis-trans isomerase CYP38, chloroplastic-like [Brassica rapa]